jgi:anti-sigma factor RsiW
MTYRDHVSTETLADHAEGLLGESDAGRVQAHLDECEDCRAEALLLVSLQEILRADEVGPMPVEYASRIDVALAELAATEPPMRLHPAPVPILNAPAEAAPAALGGAKVIDLATRRKVMMTGLRRVGTVAAGVVLLIGGAALGVQTLGNHTDLVPPVNHDAIDNARSFAKLPTAPATAKSGKHGIKTDPKTGWIYLNSGKVLLPDGTVILPGANKSDPPTVISPKQAAATTAPAPKATTTTPKGSKGSGQAPETIKKPTKPTAPKAPAVAPGDPADPQASNATSAPATPAAQQPDAAKTQVAPGPDANQQPVRTADAGKPNKDTYVSQSGSEYTQDNFANKVMDLMGQASAGSSSPGNYTATSSGNPQSDPTEGPTAGPTTAPNPSISPSMTPQNLAISYYDQRQADIAAAQAPGRGPASPEVKYRVQRCATQLGTTALAGDEGTWGGHKATIVVTPTDNPNQVMGYVFYGNCSASSPASEANAQWEQRVNKPSAAPDADSSAPVKRVGGTEPGSNGSRSESREH